ncbi:NAD-dependent deacylase [Neiella marina]|uniref:protein acetyllysine N-acetyltransferase n=1 Tax=Neiella holothuriorum TaxID=2870530 RepID=A0ABS7EK64_9GAMM|nr:Sir2 family NAD-dependent protein deacetylase [Neiella holothuriorum]MBW8192747.1 NAD-dependent deacylase [Neiella holothuriorum]
MKPPINHQQIVVFTGSGISAASGIPTYQSNDGQRMQPAISAHSWKEDPELVLKHFNQRRQLMSQAKPNAAHTAIAALETNYKVIVITQNLDDLHEQAGSTEVLHLHGSIHHARSRGKDQSRLRLNSDLCLNSATPDGHPLRPDVVWFGEAPLHIEQAKHHMKTAEKVLVIGTSLTVQPAASLLKHARYDAEKVLVTKSIAKIPFGFKYRPGDATELVPLLVKKWLAEFESSNDRSNN